MLAGMEERVHKLIPIGRFSKITRLTVKALRHYCDIGVLRPAYVDPETAYRYYSYSQCMEAERIRMLRQLDLPLSEIATLLNQADPMEVRKRLEQHRQRLLQQMDQQQHALVILDRLINLEEDIMPYDVAIREIEAQHILSVRSHTPAAQLTELFGKTFGEIFGYLGQLGIGPVGPPFSIYHDPDFKEDDIDIEICVPVERAMAGNQRVQASTLAAATAATTLHCGVYDSIGNAYQALSAWAQEHGHEFAGPPREVYLVGPPQVADPAEYRTEIVWPIQTAQ